MVARKLRKINATALDYLPAAIAGHRQHFLNVLNK